MPIYFRELARTRIALIVWSVTMAVFCIFLMTFFPTIREQAVKLDELMQQYPKELVEAFIFDRLRMADPMGFYGTQVYLFITLFGGIYAMLLFVSVLSREESEKTSEFLLAQAVSRARIVTEKSLAALTDIVLFNASFGICNFILFEIYAKGEYEQRILLLLILGPFLMHLFFGGIGLLISVFMVKARAVYPVSIGVVLGMYFLSVVSTLSDRAENLRYLTPFKYVDAADIVEDGRIAVLSLVVIGGVVALSVLATYVFYQRKDISC